MNCHCGVINTTRGLRSRIRCRADGHANRNTRASRVERGQFARPAVRTDGEISEARFGDLEGDFLVRIALRVNLEGDVRPVFSIVAKNETTSPISTGCLNRNELTATVATRPRARRDAGIDPARSTCDMIQPPKMSPWKFASAGIGVTRRAGMPGGSWTLTRSPRSLRPASPRRATAGAGSCPRSTWEARGGTRRRAGICTRSGARGNARSPARP